MKSDNKETSAIDLVKVQLGQSKLYQELVKRESNYIEKIIQIFQYAEVTLPKINRIFANYTGHGIEHSMGVMKYMYDLVTKIEDLSDLEITCLIYAALLHDIGMVANEKEIEAIKKDELIYNKRKYSAVFDKYKKENIALQECIRPAHGERAYKHIMEMDKSYFIVSGYTNNNFQEEVAKICQAHTTDHDWLLCNLDHEQVKGVDELNTQYLAMLLRVADYLDIDESRTPIELYRLINPTGYGDNEWKQHFIIENQDKIVRDRNTQLGTVTIYGECDDSKIHRKLLFYFDNVSEELKWCANYSQRFFKSKYHILLLHSIDNRIKTNGFEVSDLKLQMDYRAIMDLLMSEKLYDDKKYGLRELLQNCIDACKVMVEETKDLPKYLYNSYNPEIKIIFDIRNRKMIVLDNGTGMNYDIFTKYFLNVGKSYYRSDEFLYQRKEYQPIGTFGIGFLACLMLSENVTVETRHYTELKGFSIELEKGSEYLCKKGSTNYIGEHGTAVILNLESVLAVFENQKNIEDFIKKTFLEQKVSIQFIEASNIEIIQLYNLYGILLKNLIDVYRLDRINDFLDQHNMINKKYYELFEQKIVSLDKYLNDLSVYAFLNDIKFIKFNKLSDIFSKIIYEFEDLSLNELEKYIYNDMLCVIRIGSWLNSKENKIIIDPVQFKGMDMVCKNLILKDEQIFVPDNDNVKWYNLKKYKNEPKNKLSSYIDEIRENISKKKKYKEFLDEKVDISVGFIEVSRIDNVYIITGSLRRSLFLPLKKTIYTNGIFISDYVPHLINPFLRNENILFDIESTAAINILNNNIRLNISRNNLSYVDRKSIDASITRAIIQYQIDKTDDKKMKNVLEKIAHEYSQENDTKYYNDYYN